jgi:hypothetical protein
MLEALILALALQTSTIVKNPRNVEFTCSDHATDTAHELDIINASGAVIQTLQLGDPPMGTDNIVRATINVQPIAFGTYTAKVRALVGTSKSEDSLPSNPFERAPGTPGSVIVK